VSERLTQRDRVLQALQRVGSHGLTQVDFQPPSVIDGGAPITRVAARIEELRDAGHRIDSTGRRDKCVIYVLRDKPVRHEPITPAGEAPVASLFGPGPRSAIFDYDPDLGDVA
jgi:hypothetical protein